MLFEFLKKDMFELKTHFELCFLLRRFVEPGCDDVHFALRLSAIQVGQNEELEIK